MMLRTFTSNRLLTSLALNMLFSITLLFIRVVITQSEFYLFLLWNLFLAGIPFLMSRWLKKRPALSWFKVVVTGGIWLLFLPNAPYIITDFMHLRIGTAISFWYDLFLVGSFSMNGMFLFFLSLKDMKSVLTLRLGTTFTTVVLTLIVFLSGFGIYLGRFQRWNSWDLLQDPFALLHAIKRLVFQPISHWEVWAFTGIFGLFLTLGFYMFQSIAKIPVE